MSIEVRNLKTEYRKDPIAIDSKNPRFFWQIVSDGYNVSQKSFKICVATDKELLKSGSPDMWDSGIVESDETVAIKYAGKCLDEKTDYYWSVYSDCGEAGEDISYDGYFRTGMFSNDSWTAKWIENAEIEPEDAPAHSGFLSKTVNDPHEVLKVTVDLDTVRTFDCVAFYGLRVFEFPGIADFPGYQFPRKYRIYAHSGLDSKDIQIIEDKTQEIVPNPGAVPVYIFPGKITARYVTFEAVELQAYEEGKYSFGLSQIEVFNGCDIISEYKKVIADDGWYEGEGFGPEFLTDTTPTWHKKGNAKPLPGPFMRKIFELEKNPEKAYVYVSALGIYELYINGEKVSDAYLAPEWTNYDRYVQYSCFEVSDMLQKGENEILAMLGDGWYAGRIGMANVFGPKVLRGKYGKTPKFIMQLEIPDEEPICTDGTWESCANTPVRKNDIYDGEFYDARYEDILAWNPVRTADPDEVGNITLKSFINEQIVSYEDIEPLSVTETEKGTFVVDFGKNVSGFCEITMRGERNRKVMLRHACALKADGTGHYANLRGAFAIDTYIFKDSKKVTFRPHFTYHGFRYLEIIGLDYKPAKNDIICHSISSGFEETGFMLFENEFYNWLLAASKQTIRANHVGVITDCNDRDERLPWLMEGLDSMSYLFDGTLFWERHVHELIEGYKQEGRMISQAPDGLIILLPPGVIARTLINNFELEYALYGNDLADEDFYELLLKIYEENIKKYPDHIGGDPDYTDCDWLNTNKLMADTGINKDIPQISDQVFTSVTFATFYRMMAKYAEILGKNDDQSRFKASFRHSVDQIEKILVDGDNGLKNASQGAYGMMLHFNTISAKNEHLFEQKLKELIERNDCRFATGVYTVGSLIRALSAHKMHDLAYKMMTDDRCPSFKYMMDEGSQTIWERWDTRMPELPYLYEKPRWQQQNKTQTIIVENGIEDCSMNSFDHIEFTTVTPWITEYVFGLRTNVNDGPAMKHFTFKTESITENRSAKGHFDTIRGKIEISWRINNKTYECKINIPANMKCTFCIPDEFENVTVNNKDEENMKIELGSGRYYIKAEKLF